MAVILFYLPLFIFFYLSNERYLDLNLTLDKFHDFGTKV